MGHIFRRSRSNGSEIIETDYEGYYLLNEPLLNKGTAFTEAERKDFKILGALPQRVSRIDDQIKRRYQNFQQAANDLDKFTFLYALQNRNEVLYFRLIYEHIEEMLPYIYTPTVGKASVHYSYIYNAIRGVYFSYPQREHLDTIVEGIPRDAIDVIVITDGSRVLGLGDLGVGGMVIPVGKLALYTLFGGIHPARTLPVVLDVGTDNSELLEDPLYIGWRHPRIEPEAYYPFVEQVVRALQKRFPHVLLQWEDFQKKYARPLLEKYQRSICSFNDDIQGTAAVALAAVLSATLAEGVGLQEQRICIVGGGSAGIGIANLLRKALVGEGLSDLEACDRIAIVDVNGLVHEGLAEIASSQKPYAKRSETLLEWGLSSEKSISLEETVIHGRVNILIGVSGQKAIFTEKIVKAMYANCHRPIIFPLSNPKNNAEATPQEVLLWTDGNAHVATGSPFDDVFLYQKTRRITQCNNVYIFPGVGLGAIAVKARHIPDSVFLCAAQTLASVSPRKDDPDAPLFPNIADLREVSKKIAIAVGKHLIQEGCGNETSSSVEELVEETMWHPEYAEFRAVR